MTVLLNFEQILKLKRDEDDYFYCRYRAPRVIHKQKTGIFAHYQRKWTKSYCNDKVLMENSCLHVPSDLMVSHFLCLECPITNRLANSSAWSLKLSVVNAEYTLRSYSFLLDRQLFDYQMIPNWDRRLNADATTMQEILTPELDQVHDHLVKMINRHWFKHHNKNARHSAVQKLLGIDGTTLQQQLEALVPPLEPLSTICSAKDQVVEAMEVDE